MRAWPGSRRAPSGGGSAATTGGPTGRTSAKTLVLSVAGFLFALYLALEEALA
jgi:hypothetical protein